MYTSSVGLTTTIELYARFVATNTTNPCFKPSQTLLQLHQEHDPDASGSS